ncbi:MAG: hypothetical protein EBY40_08385 [Marivivens sp.]|nr:hypothetical protein [Marivivens sp.]
MSNIDGLLADWLDAKAAEQKAQALRHKIEAQITAAFDTKPEGAITHKTDMHKVTLTQPIYRKVDLRKWEMVKDRIPTALHPIKVKIEADAAGMKWLANNEPDMWAKVAAAFETRPGKIGVKVGRVQ